VVTGRGRDVVHHGWQRVTHVAVKREVDRFAAKVARHPKTTGALAVQPLKVFEFIPFAELCPRSNEPQHNSSRQKKRSDNISPFKATAEYINPVQRE
jgi:hypothetical protein